MPQTDESTLCSTEAVQPPNLAWLISLLKLEMWKIYITCCSTKVILLNFFGEKYKSYIDMCSSRLISCAIERNKKVKI
jgi:hypothetical protein